MQQNVVRHTRARGSCLWQLQRTPEGEAAARVSVQPGALFHRHRVAAAVLARDKDDWRGVEGRREAGGADKKGRVPGCVGGAWVSESVAGEGVELQCAGACSSGSRLRVLRSAMLVVLRTEGDAPARSRHVAAAPVSEAGTDEAGAHHWNIRDSAPTRTKSTPKKPSHLPTIVRLNSGSRGYA